MNKKTIYGILAVIVVVAFVVLAVKNAHAPVIVQTTPPVVTPTSTATYMCSAGKQISASFYDGVTKPAPSPDQPPAPGGTVALTLSDGRTMTLHQTISADGGRYANTDESFVFWSKGNGATVLEDNQEKSFTGCIVLPPQTSGLPQAYANSADGFSLRLPSLVASANVADGYVVDESYSYQALGPGKDIYGIKFTIPKSLTTGTNLSPDSYISVEQIPKAKSCSADLFSGLGVKAKTVTEGDMTYSVATSADAGAGNRYDETVYALPGTNPCMAVRYFIHYGAFENYPTGTVTQFDEKALIAQFDQIRKTLIVNQ